jgi:hypothetical protein
MITRNEYMENSSQLHQAYYAQFVTRFTLSQVAMAIGVDAIKTSTDRHFNDIPLVRWDRLVGWTGGWVNKWFGNRTILNFNREKFKAASGRTDGKLVYSASDMICIAKAAAKMIQENPEILENLENSENP